MASTKTKQAYEELLNECGVPKDERKSNGGWVPDNVKYGSWLRRNDPIAFDTYYWDWLKG